MKGPDNVRGQHALLKLLQDFNFNSVIDIGAGSGDVTDQLLEAGKDVIVVDPGHSGYYKQREWSETDHLKIFNQTWEDFDVSSIDPPDCIWACHVLEHSLCPHYFLKKCFNTLPDNSILAIVVPPLKQQIVGGHLSLWNAGLLLYHLIIAGFDCSQACVNTYHYNVCVIVEKTPASQDVLGSLTHDYGDIEKLAPYFPCKVRQRFKGNLLGEINW